MINRIAQKMIAETGNNIAQINHFLKVHSFARIIGQGEKLSEHQLYLLELEALVHDISCPYLYQKYGKAPGDMQQQVSEPLLRAFFKDEDICSEDLERIIYVVCHHHTYSNVDGIDYQIILEADFLVNGYESSYSKEAIENMAKNVYKTETGKRLLQQMYLKGK